MNRPGFAEALVCTLFVLMFKSLLIAYRHFRAVAQVASAVIDTESGADSFLNTHPEAIEPAIYSAKAYSSFID